MLIDLAFLKYLLMPCSQVNLRKSVGESSYTHSFRYRFTRGIF